MNIIAKLLLDLSVVKRANTKNSFQNSHVSWITLEKLSITKISPWFLWHKYAMHYQMYAIWQLILRVKTHLHGKLILQVWPRFFNQNMLKNSDKRSRLPYSSWWSTLSVLVGDEQKWKMCGIFQNIVLKFIFATFKVDIC